MKNDRLFAFVLSAFVLCLSACEKNDPAVSLVSAKLNKMVMSVTGPSVSSVDTFYYTYDAGDRLTSEFTNFSGNRINYIYNGSSGFSAELYKNNVPGSRILFFYNSNQKVDSILVTNSSDSASSRLIYNATGQLIIRKDYSKPATGNSVVWKTTAYSYDGNGNVSAITETDSIGIVLLIGTYTYNTIKPNWYVYLPDGMPELYKNLPVSVSQFYPVANQTVNSTITYEFDSNNRITKETYSASTGVVSIKQFDYL